MLDFFSIIDTEIFKFLNGSLIQYPNSQTFWGLLNHKWEASINLIMAGFINLLLLISTRDTALRKIRFFQLLYFWVCFQIGFMIQNWFFHTYLEIARLSPSLVVTPVLRLSHTLNNPLIKDFSEHCFPSGHAFAMIYWASFTYLCASRKIGKLSLCLGIFLCIPRLVGGAHWFSDVLFGALLALLWLVLSVQTPLYRFLQGLKQGVKPSIWVSNTA